MSIEEVYRLFEIKVNQNATTNNLAIDKPRFIRIFNEAQTKYLQWLIKHREDESYRFVKDFLVPDEILVSNGKSNDKEHFTLPEDFMDITNLDVFASKGSCASDRIEMEEKKPDNIGKVFSDTSMEPSFLYRQAIYTLTSRGITIYYGDMDIDKVFIDYYRCPRLVDLKGYQINSITVSTSIDPEWDKRNIYRILDSIIIKFNKNNNENSYQVDTNEFLTQY